ncbi:right-handed parallel beta-helix repeat-containing protein [Streptosporangium saharense]|uniref:right-handed parallel beta-helix repeat-containing protein n=1 Tax=Streptosporangium saharense TaxID=1706840 RepID=UPI003442C158
MSPKTVRTTVAVALAAAGLGAATTAPALASPVASPETEVTCGTVVTSDLVLTADLVCSGTALVVGADGLRIDLAGHTLRGPDGVGSGIEVGDRDKTTVDNGTISGFASGISATGGDAKYSWTRLTVSRTRLTGNARIRLTSATATISGTPQNCVLDGLSAVRSTVTVNGCTVHNGVLLDRSRGTIRSSALSGGALRLDGATDGFYGDNVFDGFGVLVQGRSARNLFAGNTMRNTATAVSVTTSQAPGVTNTFKDNLVRDTNIGFLAHDATGFALWGNRFVTNRSAGVLIDNAGDRPTSEWVAGNVFTGNGSRPNGTRDRDGNPVRGGIHVRTVPGARINLARNTGAANTGPLIWAPPGQAVDGGGNQGPCLPVPSDLACG